MRRPVGSVRASRRLALVVVSALFVTLTGCSSSDVDQTTPGTRYEFNGATPAGQAIETTSRAVAPSFSGELLDGTPFDSADLAGDIAVINFWGSWCAPCRVETPEFQDVYAELRDEGVQFLGVDVKDDRQMASAFMTKVGAEYSSMFDPRGEVAMAFRGFPANVVPSTIVLDTEGRVAGVYTGAVTRDDLQSVLSSLLQETGG
ncbi:TlpA family protein disulfide reductase [Blastococcus sp. KM273128]|nr:TlpA family protein disulfide reductase [Blastococcus sp. KM273128]